MIVSAFLHEEWVSCYHILNISFTFKINKLIIYMENKKIRDRRQAKIGKIKFILFGLRTVRENKVSFVWIFKNNEIYIT